jgi:hypothetical protein
MSTTTKPKLVHSHFKVCQIFLLIYNCNFSSDECYTFLETGKKAFME